MGSRNTLIDSRDKLCQFILNKKLLELVQGIDKPYSRVAVVCIGTDTCTGDTYGPLVGTFLSRWSIYDFDLYGTIHRPVHAKNLLEALEKIDTEHTLVLAVDSSLGLHSHIGRINIGNSPLKPGSGLGKSLPEVGDIHIEGIVNISGFLPMLVLQTTRLSLVYSMAEITARSIQYVLFRLGKVKAQAYSR